MRITPDFPQRSLPLPGGAAGTRQTLREMARLVRDYRTRPEFRAMARELIGGLSNGNYVAEAEAAFAFVRDDIHYVGGVNGVQQLQAPDVTLAQRAGMCVDMSVLLATLLESIGHPARFVAVGYQGPQCDHVFTETKVGDEWIAMDPSQSVPFGWAPLMPWIDQPVSCLMREWV